MPSHAADGTRLRLVVPNHAPSKLAKEPPITFAQPLWRLARSGHVAERAATKSTASGWS